MKKILLTFVIAGLLLTVCACSCGGDTIETKPTTPTESSVEDAIVNGGVLSDGQEIIIDDSDDSDNSDDSVDSDNSDDSDNSGENNQIEVTANDDNSKASDSSNTKNTTAENSPMEITDKTTISAYASYITDGTWINNSSGDTIVFNDNGTFSGKINGKKYSGTFNMRIKENKVCALGVTLEGTKEEVEFTARFENSAKITLTTNKGDSESFILQ